MDNPTRRMPKNNENNKLISPEERTELDDIVDQNIDSIVALHMRAESKAGQHQLTIERLIAFLGRPWYLYFIVLCVFLWIGLNLLLLIFHRASIDPAPFYWLQGAITLNALLTTTAVLIKQNRQEKQQGLHSHLDFQVNLLVEQKVTKLIGLVEELRRDLPSVKNRHDPQAEAMKQPVDPHDVMHNLHQSFNEAQQNL